jgi:hypothetical protein
MGKCPEYKTSTSNFTVRYRVTSVAATITWAEVAIATGGFVLGGPSLLSTIAYTNISGTLLSTGQKSTTISMLSATSPIVPGNDIWVLFGVNATTTGIYRAASIADDLQSGVQLVSAAGIRPSTMSTGTSFSVEGATILPMWISLRV